MDLKTIALLVVAAIVLFWMFQRSRGDLTGEQARALVEDGALLLDVRSAGEYQGGHIEGAVNIPIDQLGSRLSELPDRERPIVVYCQSGMRSASATKLLRDAGYDDIHNLGGIGNW